MEFRKWLEMSYGEADIPKFFYLCCNLNQELINGVMHNLQGISASPQISRFWRQCFLQMPANEVMRVNKLSRVMYGNPDYMVSKDLRAMHRVSPISKFEPFKLGLLLSLVHGLSLPIPQIQKLEQGLKPYLKGISNLKDYMRVVYDYLNKNGLNLQPSERSVKFFQDVVNNQTSYASEQEWMVKPSYVRMADQINNLPVFRVPQDHSICLIHPLITDNTPNPPTPQTTYFFKPKVTKKDFIIRRLISQLATKMRVYTPPYSEVKGQTVEEIIEKAVAGEFPLVTPELV